MRSKLTLNLSARDQAPERPAALAAVATRLASTGDVRIGERVAPTKHGLY